MTVDTNKAREIAQQWKDKAADERDEYFTSIDADRSQKTAALLLALADAHDRMAKDAARYKWLRQPDPLKRAAHIAVLTHNGGWVASGEQADAAIDAAMGADQRGKK